MKTGDYKAIGKVVQVIGPVVDVQFEEEKLPAIFNAIHHATRVRLRHAPATPDRVRTALLKAYQ